MDLLSFPDHFITLYLSYTALPYIGFPVISNFYDIPLY